MKSIQNWFSFIPMFLIFCALAQVNLYRPLQVITVETRAQPSTFYLSGIIKPTQLQSVNSPVEGTVSQIRIPYGFWVKRKTLLFILDAPKLAEDYRQNLEALIKAERTYQNTLFQNNGNAALFKLGLISKVAFMDNSQQLQNASLDLFESKARLTKMLEGVDEKMPNLKDLSQEDLQKILQKNLRKINIYSPDEGYLFFPTNSLTGGEAASKLVVGSSVKQGQILGFIGNMESIYLELLINETELRKFKIGQKANITGPAFAGINLEGVVKSISRQTSSQDESPTYSIVVVVPQLAPELRDHITLGMSADVAFTQENPVTVWIPLEALHSENGKYWVQKLDNNGNTHEVTVVPGKTDENSIQILQGLDSGDRVALTH